MRQIGLVILVALLLGAPVPGQQKPPPDPKAVPAVSAPVIDVPALTPDQDAQLTALMTIVQYAAQQTAKKQVELDAAKRAQDEAIQQARDFLQSIQKPGFTFDMQARKYVPVKKEPK